MTPSPRMARLARLPRALHRRDSQAGVLVRSWDALPSSDLVPDGEVTAQFLGRDVADYRSAGKYLWALPYGRTADRADFRAVLREGRGTCSTKHALLACLAREQSLPVTLMLGIYEMREANTPGVGPVLGSSGLDWLPEAHCYLAYAGNRIDVTRTGSEPAEPIQRFLHEERITPEQIGQYKLALHRGFVAQWIGANPEMVHGLTFAEVWAIREACIGALEQ